MVLPEFHPIDLASPDGAALVGAIADRHGDALAQAATRLERLFLLRSPWAPGLRFVGAQARPVAMAMAAPTAAGASDARISLAGGGETIEDAFVSCVGEAVERLSQFEHHGDGASQRIADANGHLSGAVAELVSRQCRQNGIPDTAVAHWSPARDIATGTPQLVPADWVLRRPSDGVLRDRESALSTGSAAGPSMDAAVLRALLELVERDAAALWWLGGRRARPFAANGRAAAEAARLTDVLRQGDTSRRTWILDITSDLGIPTAAAISVDLDGRGFVCGLAARLSPREAVRAAIGELCQLEIGLLLARIKLAQTGGAALTDLDRRHLDRATRIDAATCDLLHPAGAPRDDVEPDAVTAADDATAAAELSHLTQILAAAGIDAAIVDLTRPAFGIPVVKAIAPRLQALPSSLTTERLLDTISTTGGGGRFTSDVPLT